MYPEQTPEQEQPEIVSGCANCGSSFVEPDRPTKLCTECRNSFIRYPIPIWIKGFGIGIGLVVIFALFNLPKQLSIGVHFERGKNAMAERRFVTAQKELKEFTQQVPASNEALMHLAIASFYNMDVKTFSQTMDKLQGKEVENDELFDRVNAVIDKMGTYVPPDSLLAVIKNYNDDAEQVPDSVYINYIQHNKDEVWAAVQFSSKLYSAEKYQQCDSMLQCIMNIDDENVLALRLLSSLKRLQDSMARSIHYCDVMLRLNQEDAYAMASKARSLLRLKKDTQAMSLIQDAMKVDAKDGYTQATLALAYHVNNKTKERDQIISELKKDSLGSYYLEYVTDVMSGKEKFR